MKKTAFIILLSSIILLSCSSTPSKKVNLDDTLFKYASYIRWSDYDSAAQFIKASDGSIVLSSFELQKLKQFKVSRYSESPISPGKTENTIIQKVEIQIYNIHNNQTRTIHDLQTWEYNEEAKQWFLLTGLPKL